MVDEKFSDVDRLVQCFTRGVAQRRQHQRHRNSEPNTPTKLRYSSSPNAPSSEGVSSGVNTRTPQTPRFNLPSQANVMSLSGKGKVSPRSGSKQISPGVFYGSPFGKPSNKPLHVLRLLNEIQNDLEENHSRDIESAGAFKLTSATRAAIWATFPKQEQAIQFAESNVDNKIAVFQYQDHLNGQRRFLATSYAEFWQRYKSMLPEHRHHYEIIQEGKPCHLYFDLEFKCKANAEADGEAMVDILLTLVQKVFLDNYALEYDPSWTVELDSSTKDKFSRHLIIRVPGAAFKDNTNVGLFVGEICRRIHSHRKSCEDFSRLFVLQGDSLASHHTELFIDQAVYSRNRSFRLPFSSKAGKVAKLLPTMRFRTTNLEQKDIFMDSLICRVGDSCERLLTFGLEPQKNAGRGGTVNYAIWKGNPRCPPPKRSGFSLSGKSPFPALDIFVESVACIGEIQGKIRSWYWFSEYGVVVYNISENRYCENIGRHHKSNNVMYVVDFRTAGYYQKCHDPDCRGYLTHVTDSFRTRLYVNIHPFCSYLGLTPPAVDRTMTDQIRYRSPLRPIPGHTIPTEYSFQACSISGEEIVQRRDQIRLFEEESEDESWWEEVALSAASMESHVFQSQNVDQELLCHEDVAVDGDDDWWTAVLPEVAALESSMSKQRE